MLNKCTTCLSPQVRHARFQEIDNWCPDAFVMPNAPMFLGMHVSTIVLGYALFSAVFTLVAFVLIWRGTYEILQMWIFGKWLLQVSLISTEDSDTHTHTHTQTHTHASALSPSMTHIPTHSCDQIAPVSFGKNQNQRDSGLWVRNDDLSLLSLSFSSLSSLLLFPSCSCCLSLYPLALAVRNSSFPSAELSVSSVPSMHREIVL